jgi:hypothetical protein
MLDFHHSNLELGMVVRLCLLRVLSDFSEQGLVVQRHRSRWSRFQVVSPEFKGLGGRTWGCSLDDADFEELI